jgi:hypothetical protein
MVLVRLASPSICCEVSLSVEQALDTPCISCSTRWAKVWLMLSMRCWRSALAAASADCRFAASVSWSRCLRSSPRIASSACSTRPNSSLARDVIGCSSSAGDRPRRVHRLLQRSHDHLQQEPRSSHQQHSDRRR